MSLIIRVENGKTKSGYEPGEGFERDEARRIRSREGFCTAMVHPQDRPRRFDAGEVNPPPVCPICRDKLATMHKKYCDEGVPVGNRALPTALATRGVAPPGRA